MKKKDSYPPIGYCEYSHAAEAERLNKLNELIQSLKDCADIYAFAKEIDAKWLEREFLYNSESFSEATAEAIKRLYKYINYRIAGFSRTEIMELRSKTNFSAIYRTVHELNSRIMHNPAVCTSVAS